MKNRKYLPLAVALIGIFAGTISIAAAGFDRFKDHVKIGQGTATDKTLEFDIGAGANNPKVIVNGSTGVISLLPTGAITPYAGSSAPTGWLMADGSAVSRTTYARLFAVIGTTYGVGDGSTTFNLPDLRGRTVAGDDDMGGSAASRLTNASSGITGTTLGAAGGSQTQAAAGTIGGTQGIDHQHIMAHTHIHSHRSGASALWSLITSDSSTTSIPATTTATTGALVRPASTTVQTVGAFTPLDMGTGDGPFYTTGVMSPPAGGNGSTAKTASMDSNNVVNGSSFTFTGSQTNTVQPTLVLNYIVKT